MYGIKCIEVITNSRVVPMIKQGVKICEIMERFLLDLSKEFCDLELNTIDKQGILNLSRYGFRVMFQLFFVCLGFMAYEPL